MVRLHIAAWTSVASLLSQTVCNFVPTIVSGNADLVLAGTGLSHALAQHTHAMTLFNLFLHQQYGDGIPLQLFPHFVDVLNSQGRRETEYREIYREAADNLDDMGLISLHVRTSTAQNAALSSRPLYASLIDADSALGRRLSLEGRDTEAGKMAFSVWEIYAGKYPVLRSIQMLDRITQAESDWAQITTSAAWLRPRSWPWEERVYFRRSRDR